MSIVDDTRASFWVGKTKLGVELSSFSNCYRSSSLFVSSLEWIDEESEKTKRQYCFLLVTLV